MGFSFCGLGPRPSPSMPTLSLAHGRPVAQGRTVNPQPASLHIQPATESRKQSQHFFLHSSASFPSSAPASYIIPNFIPTFPYKASRFRTSHSPHSLQLLRIRTSPLPPRSRTSGIPLDPAAAAQRTRSAPQHRQATRSRWPHSSCTGGPPSGCASPRRSTRWSPAAPSAPSSPSRCSSSSTSL